MLTSGSWRVPVLVAAVVLGALLYPTLFLGQRLAPEASLRNFPPWHSLWGPYPSPPPQAVRAATHLGPRLATIARDGASAALWNPWIGGGRAGWLAAASEGGAPLSLAAALLANDGWKWSALLALEIVAALLAAWWAFRLLGLNSWPAAVGATAYALSGAVAGAWLSWRGSALALGPLLLVPVLATGGFRQRVARWGAATLLVVAGGPPAAPFVALAMTLALLEGKPRRVAIAAPLAAAALVLAVAWPRLWLARAAAEPGAAVPVVPAPPLTGWRALVTAGAGSSLPRGTGALAARENPGYVGAAVLLLAAIGIATAPPRMRALLAGVAAVAVAIVAAPAAAIGPLAEVRPFGVLALAAAALAGYGAQWLASRWPRSPAAVGAAVWALIAVGLLPAAARRLPYAPADESDLRRPLPDAVSGPDTRVAALLGALPPDVGATLAVADVRAASLAAEPRYAALLGASRDGELPVGRALDPETARLGARYLLEPLPARVVSGEIFARAEPLALRAAAAPGQYDVSVPPLATRLGLTGVPAGTLVFLTVAGDTVKLDGDDALAAESAEWRWFAVPRGVAAGAGLLRVESSTGARLVPLAAAWDASGLRLAAAAERGVRLWQWDAARPPAFLAAGVQGEARGVPVDPAVVTVPEARLAALRRLTGRGTVTTVTGDAWVAATVDCDRPSLLAVQVKFRPALWHATIDGAPASCVRVDGVWTAVALPAGRTHVRLVAAVPVWVWAVASAGVALLVLLAWPWGRR